MAQTESHGPSIQPIGATVRTNAAPEDASAGDIGVADVIRAWRALDARDDDERRAIARLLGFDLREATPIPERPRRPPPPPPRPDATVDAIDPPAPPPASEEPHAIDLVPFSDVNVNPVELPARGLPRPAVVAPAALEPLFSPSWSRTIASTLTERAAAVGPIDVERTIDLIARRLPIVRLPRRRRLVSAAEVIVIIDGRATLAWFREDAGLLVERIDAVTRATVRVVESDGAPVLATAMGAPAAARVTADDEPAPDRVRIGAQGRVIGLTDLGLGSPWTRGDPRRASAWGELAVALRARGASLVIVTPVPVERIPPQLARLAPCIYWDRATPPGAIHRRLKGLP